MIKGRRIARAFVYPGVAGAELTRTTQAEAMARLFEEFDHATD